MWRHVEGPIRHLDRYQRSRRWIGLPVAVLYKYYDDQGTYLAAIITYFGFLSVFPLLLIFVAVLGFLLSSHPELRDEAVGSVLGHFPIIGDQLTSTADTPTGNLPGLIVGILVALFGALKVGHAGQVTFNWMWAVPRRSWPYPLGTTIRSLALVIVVGVGIPGATALSAVTTTEHSAVTSLFGSVPSRILAATMAVAVNFGLGLWAFRVLTATRLRFRQIWTGALFCAVAWYLLQTAGTYFVGELEDTSPAFGVFGLVLGLVAWIYLFAIITVFGTELNVVRAHRLWPRTLRLVLPENAALTRADRRAFRLYTAAQQHAASQRVHVAFEQRASARSDDEQTLPHIPRVDRPRAAERADQPHRR